MSGWKNMPEAYIRIKTPGLTTITNDMIEDPGLEEWIKQVGQETADKITKAANYRGTAMHSFIENFLTKYKEVKEPGAALKHTQIVTPKILIEEDPTMPQHKIDEGRDLFYKLYYSDIINEISDVVKTELSLYSPLFYYRGFADLVYIKKGYGRAISDFKTLSKPIQKGSIKEKKYKLQLGGYAIALEDMLENKVSVNYASIIGVQTKTNLIQEIVLSDKELEEYKKEFCALAREWHIKNGQDFLFV